MESGTARTTSASRRPHRQHTALPDGFSLRLGRFYSNIGYLNSHHAHTDNFFDRPLPYQAFLGNQYGDDGVQLRWVAPTALFLELGGEGPSAGRTTRAAARGTAAWARARCSRTSAATPAATTNGWSACRR